MSTQTVKLNKEAMRLVDTTGHVEVKFIEGDNKKPTLEMTAYSGGIIKNHWYWGDLAIDLEGMAIPKNKIPILEDHLTELKIGFATKFSKDGNKLTVLDATFVDSPESLKFRELSSQGFPYEASIYAKPTQIQTLQKDEVADVNGFTMNGPGTIWRKCTLKESSVCTFGYDSNTSSKAMADNGEDVSIDFTGSTAEQLNQKEETKSMDINQFKKDHPELAKQFAEEVTAIVQEQFSAEKAALEVKLTQATEQNTKLSEDNKTTEKRMLALEKAEGIRTEAALKHTADSIFSQKFAATELPDRLSEKVRKMVSHDQFIADGVFDKEAFSTAVDAELKDWVADDTGDSVLGFGANTKDLADPTDTKNTKLTDDTSNRMLSYLKPKK